MHNVVEKDIAVAPERAFDLMADARYEPQWNSRVTTSELVSAEPIGQGSRFRTVNRGRPYDATITTYDRPGQLVFEVTGKAMDITARFTFAPQGAGTRYEGDFEMRPKGALKFAFPLMGGAVRKDLDRQSGSFKRLCESQAAAT
jgi:hypothetical protein